MHLKNRYVLLASLSTLVLLGGCSSEPKQSEDIYYPQPQVNQPVQPIEPSFQQPQPQVNQPIQPALPPSTGQYQGEASYSCEQLRDLIERNKEIGESAMKAANRGSSPAGTTGQSANAMRAFNRVDKYSAQMLQQGCVS